MDKCRTVPYISTATQWPAPTNSEMEITSSKEKICMRSHKEPRFIVSFEGLKREREREGGGGGEVGGGPFQGGGGGDHLECEWGTKITSGGPVENEAGSLKGALFRAVSSLKRSPGGPFLL